VILYSGGASILVYMKGNNNLTIVISKSPAKLWSDAFVSSGIKSVYRYTYGTRTAVPLISERQRTDLLMHIGATFADSQKIPKLGAWHGSECKSSMSRIS
jgi:hypothetical protein